MKTEARAPRQISIRGSIYLRHKIPAAGASLRVFVREPGRNRFLGETRSDTDGSYAFELLIDKIAPKIIVAAASADRRVTGQASAYVRGESAELIVYLSERREGSEPHSEGTAVPQYRMLASHLDLEDVDLDLITRTDIDRASVETGVSRMGVENFLRADRDRDITARAAHSSSGRGRTRQTITPRCRQSFVDCDDACNNGGVLTTCGAYGPCTNDCSTTCDCPATEICNLSTQQCELDFGPYPECRESCDCPLGQSCVAHVCQ